MDSSDVENVLRLYGADIKTSFGLKVVSSCPFAPWTHAGGSDANPSFAAFKGTYGWRYKCMACGESGPMRRMFWRHHHFSKKYNLKVNEIVYAETDEKVEVSDLDYRVGGTLAGKALHHKQPYRFTGSVSPVSGTPMHLWKEQTLTGAVVEPKKARHVPLPVDAIERFRAAPIPDYVYDRGFQRAHVEWGLGTDEKNQRWVMPVLDETQEMVGYTSRLYWEESHCFRCGTDIRRPDNPKKNVHRCPKCKQSFVKYKHHPGEWRRNAVFGAHMCSDHNPILIVEGSTDVLRLWEYGVRDAVAILGASPSSGQVQLIARLTKEVFVMGDGDHAGQLMNVEVSNMFRMHGIDVTVVALESGDPGDLNYSQVRRLLPERMFGNGEMR